MILRANEFVDQYLIEHEFVKRLHARFKQEGIAIPFPITTIAMRGGAAASEDEEKAAGHAQRVARQMPLVLCITRRR